MSNTAPQTRHAVTAIIVAHDGARLLPGLVRALEGQTHPVEQTVAVDTASRDRSGAVLGELIGEDAVFGLPRSTGFGEAVTVALRHAERRRSGMTDPGLARVDWVWLLHDDCEPAPDTLERLLRAAGKDRTVVVLGPKVLDGQDRRTLREVGVSIDRAGRRVTGIDPGEIDQGQHDHKQAVLAVGSAGMLVRRDVWDRLGGFDEGLGLFRDDVDFCWRVQAAGYRVQVVTDAVLYHRELAGRRRPSDAGNARQLDRRNALFVLAVNLPLLTMLRVVGGAVIGSLARAAYFLLTKQLDLSASYAFSVAWLFAHPVRLFQARQRRAAGRAEGYNAVRLFIPPARTLFRLAEKISGLISHGPPQASYGRHHSSVDETDEDEQFVDEQSVVRRIIGHPGVQLFAGLVLVTLIAERRLLGSGPLGGGALVPAWGGAGALWREYLAGFHAVSVGSTASAPPYLAVVAGLGTVLGGQAWLAVDVLLLGCVPFAGLAAYLASRWIVSATLARVLLAACYALLPVATGAIAAGRLGTAVAFIVLPLAAVSGGRMLTAAPRQARRAAWATGLLVAVAAAFAPLAWVLGTVFAIAALAARRWFVAVEPLNAAIVVVTPFLVLFPWSLHLLTSPAAFLSEAGLSTPALVTHGLSPAALLALSPGGPGLPPLWVTAGLVLAVAAALLPAGRVKLVIAGWAVAVAGLLAAVVVSRIAVTPPAGGQAAAGWPGVALALAAIGLLVAAGPAAQRLAELIPGAAGFRKPLAAVALAAAATAPLLVAGYWVSQGVRGPVSNVAAPVLPAFVSASSTSGAQYRTLILRQTGSGSGGLAYSVVRQADPTLGEPELGADSATAAALSRQVAALAAPDGADAGDPGLVLGQFGIKFVLLPRPVDPVLAQRLDAAIGLVAQSKAPTYDLWQVAGPVARARVVAADGTTTPLTSSAVGMAGTAAPASGGTLLLAEPYGGWSAQLNGHPLKPLASPVNGWAQGFVLPPGGGKLSVQRDNLARQASLIAELIAVLAVFLLALPGKRVDPVLEAKALAALREERGGRRGAGSSPRALRPASAAAIAAGSAAGHRAAGAANRFGLARRPRPDGGPATVTVEAPAGADLVRAGVPGRGRRERGGLDEPATPERAGAAPAVVAEAATSAGLTMPGSTAATGAIPDGTGPVRAWTPETAEDAGPGRAWRRRTGEQSRARVTGQQPSLPDVAGPQSPLPGVTGPRPSLPRVTAQQPALPRVTAQQPVLGAAASTSSGAPATAAPATAASPAAESPSGRPEGAIPESTAWGSLDGKGTAWDHQSREDNHSGTAWDDARPDTGPQRPPWEDSSWESGTSDRARSDHGRSLTSSGSQPTAASGGDPASAAAGPPPTATGSYPVSPASGHPMPPALRRPVTPAGGHPVSSSGGYPVLPDAGGTGGQPADGTGPRPARLAPWESGDWSGEPGWASILDRADGPGTGEHPVFPGRTDPGEPGRTRDYLTAPGEAGPPGRAEQVQGRPGAASEWSAQAQDRGAQAPEWASQASDRGLQAPYQAGQAPEWAGQAAGRPGSARDVAAGQDSDPAATGASAGPRPAKPERHSHRAAKHGKPSRWRGGGSRPTGDGDS